MLGLLGDLHGNFRALEAAVAVCRRREVPALIQLGDFGWYPQLPFFAELPERFELPVYWIDGNHEDHAALAPWQAAREVVEVRPNLFFVPRGTVLTLDGRCAAFMGGAGSVDKNLRLQQKLDWYAAEEVTAADIARLDGIFGVDLLLTHCPPQDIIERHFNRADLKYFGQRFDWTDPSAVRIGELWQRLNTPTLFCGHMHRAVNTGAAHILNIEQLVLV